MRLFTAFGEMAAALYDAVQMARGSKRRQDRVQGSLQELPLLEADSHGMLPRHYSERGDIPGAGCSIPPSFTRQLWQNTLSCAAKAMQASQLSLHDPFCSGLLPDSAGRLTHDQAWSSTVLCEWTEKELCGQHHPKTVLPIEKEQSRADSHSSSSSPQRNIAVHPVSLARRCPFQVSFSFFFFLFVPELLFKHFAVANYSKQSIIVVNFTSGCFPENKARVKNRHMCHLLDFSVGLHLLVYNFSGRLQLDLVDYS